MKLKRLLIIPFICLVSCGLTYQDQVVGDYFYEQRYSPIGSDYIVFSKDKTKFAYNDYRGNAYYVVRFDGKDFYGNRLGGASDELYLGYVIDAKTIHINQWASAIVSGDYVLTNIKFKGERK